ncbi:hypothetical protein IMCC9480_866 [Oxalobacteraceae bacterium IMCC9480]|nr:hypothetical protein IMCC9480_866 [Oxalobacteraceae bacterium IMCC9480]
MVVDLRGSICREEPGEPKKHSRKGSALVEGLQKGEAEKHLA